MASGGGGGNKGRKNGGGSGFQRNSRHSVPFHNWNCDPNEDNDIGDDDDDDTESLLTAPFKSKYLRLKKDHENKSNKPSIPSDPNISKPIKDKRLT